MIGEEKVFCVFCWKVIFSTSCDDRGGKRIFAKE